MIRVLNFFCVALMGLSILALYHVSERTRVTQMELAKINRQIRETRATIGVLETEWAHVAGPARRQASCHQVQGDDRRQRPRRLL